MEKITVSLAADHAENLRVLDLTKVAPIADYFVVASGNSTPHLNSLAEGTNIRLKKEGIHVYRREGTPDSGWMVLDYGDVVVHVMVDEARNYYSLENLWNDAPDLEVDTHGKVTFPKVSARKPRAAAPAEDGEEAKAKPKAARKPRKTKAAAEPEAAPAAAESAPKPKRARKPKAARE